MLQKFVCATNSQFSHVYVPPSTFKVNDSNLSPKEKCSGGKTTFKTWTCANSSFFLNTGTPQSSTTGLFSCPCYLPQGQTEDFFWVCLPSLYNFIPHEKLRFPLQRGGSPGLRETKGSLSFPVLLSSFIITSMHFAWLPSVSVQQHLASAWEGFWGSYIYIYNHEYLP